MDAGIIGVFIPIIALCIPIVAIWFKHREKVIAMERGIVIDDKGKPIVTPQNDAALQGEVEELRERLQVLERIVIDTREANSLSNEIESLRSAPQIANNGAGVPLNKKSKEQV